MFQGFSEQTVDFMWGIRFNNEKSWFEQHKELYKSCFYDPMRALADEVYERFLDRHGELDLIRRVSRIYRDAAGSTAGALIRIGCGGAWNVPPTTGAESRCFGSSWSRKATPMAWASGWRPP